MADIINIEILEDGTIKMSTDKISMPNHTNAEGLIRELVKSAGGETTRKMKGHTHHHDHEHHDHTH
jgi:hypothetical protein